MALTLRLRRLAGWLASGWALGVSALASSPASAQPAPADAAGTPPTVTPPTGTPPTGTPPTGTPPTGTPPTETPPGVAAGIPAAAAPAPPAAPPQLEPPTALVATEVPYPAGAPAHLDPITVTVKIRVGSDGLVKRVERLTTSQPTFDDAVVKAAEGFRFEPARYGGKPVAIEITFNHTFVPPPPPPPPDTGPPLNAVLRGRLIELGTRAPAAAVTVAAEVGDAMYTAETDAKGRFTLPLPAGPARVTLHGAGYKPFLQRENLAPDEALAVTYAVERERYDPYEIVVMGDQRRNEVSRITLRGAELKQVAGTFGDPFRVVQTLPGVASTISLLPFPIVRGATPSSTGFLLDGTRVPLLYHLLAGPSVIHPEFIDEVQFYPGGAPVIYGGYSGGIVDGRTRRARPDESLVDIDLNLLQTGGLFRTPVPFLDANITAAARIGYPGVILSLATNEVSLSYWDYQLRLDGGTARNGWTVFAFGGRDTLETPGPETEPGVTPPLEPSLVLGFHRLDLRLFRGSGKLDTTFRAVGGVDQTLSQGSDVSTWMVEPSLRTRYRASDALELVAGVEGTHQDTSVGTAFAASDNFTLTDITASLRQQTVGSALVEALWRPTEDWLVRPGVRTDVFYDGATTQHGVDPRLTLRRRLFTPGYRQPEPAPVIPPAEDTLADTAKATLADTAATSAAPPVAPPAATSAERPAPPPAAPTPALTDADSVWVKGGVGIFHQPPRFFLPLPGLDRMPLEYGLLQAVQYDLGVEAPLPHGFSIEVDGFFSSMDPLVFDLSVNQEDINNLGNLGLLPSETDPQNGNTQAVLDRLLQPQVGRAYGFELLLRKESRQGVYGWVSYTLSRSERKTDGGWQLHDFDRTHLVNVVAGIPLPRNWDLGLRFQYQSGRPATTTSGYNTARTDPYLRFDLRVDKRVVWAGWLLDFYVDITNTALMPEEVTAGSTIRYVLPTIGLRGRL